MYLLISHPSTITDIDCSGAMIMIMIMIMITE